MFWKHLEDHYCYTFLLWFHTMFTWIVIRTCCNITGSIKNQNHRLMILVLFSSFYHIPRTIPEVKGQGDSVWQTIREHSEQDIYRINIISNVRGTFREAYYNFWSYLGVFDHIPRMLPEVRTKKGTLFCRLSFRETLWEHLLDLVSTLKSMNVLRTL